MTTKHDLKWSGHQIDVYAGMDTPDRGLHRIAVEVKADVLPYIESFYSRSANDVASTRRWTVSAWRSISDSSANRN